MDKVFLMYQSQLSQLKLEWVGKGSIDRWVCRVKPGTIMFEVDGVDKHLAKKAFELASAKLPVKPLSFLWINFNVR